MKVVDVDGENLVGMFVGLVILWVLYSAGLVVSYSYGEKSCPKNHVIIQSEEFKNEQN